jgi:hypothetical protein
MYISIAQEMKAPMGKPQGKYWITRIPTTLTILQDKSTGYEAAHALPIYVETDPTNCENPAELEVATAFKHSAGDFMIAGNVGVSTLNSIDN